MVVSVWSKILLEASIASRSSTWVPMIWSPLHDQYVPSSPIHWVKPACSRIDSRVLNYSWLACLSL